MDELFVSKSILIHLVLDSKQDKNVDDFGDIDAHSKTLYQDYSTLEVIGIIIRSAHIFCKIKKSKALTKRVCFTFIFKVELNQPKHQVI